MKELLSDAQSLIESGQYEEAVALLCRLGPPEDARVCELIAKAYHGRNYARGDVHTARVFAEQAIAHGSADPLMKELIDASKRLDAPLGHDLKKSTWKVGGPKEKRPEAEAPYSFVALSKLNGKADQPKDFQWLEKNIPCQKACPASTDIPGYLSAIYEGDHEKAYRINLRDNVFPAVLGRVCARPCESACRHGWEGLGDPVAICFSKRSAADFGGQEPVLMEKYFPASGKSVAVIGSGVAGLAAARQLALLGHDVTVYEKHDKPGGMMNQGIPVFRLPRDIIEKEIGQIEALGVKIICNAEIGKTVGLEELTEQNDAVVLAAGTLRPNLLKLPGSDLKGIRHGLEFLLEVNETGKTDIGEHVVVIGGGFTAMDCARTARRLGAATVQIEEELADKTAVSGSILRIPKGKVRVWYRRSVDEMLVTPGELEELEKEHIPLETMVSPKEYVGENGRIKAIRFVRTELGEPGLDGRRRPVDVAGSEFDIPADTILLATGQFPDTSWIEGALKNDLVEEDGWLRSGTACTTVRDKIFAAGDFATGASSLIQAIGHAKQCAREVDQFLTGRQRLKDVAVIEDVEETGRIREMDFVGLQPMSNIDLTHRDLTNEVETGFETETSRDEAQRCYQCHYKFEIDSDKCIYCDWCVKAKPRPDCILKLSKLKYNPDGTVAGWDIAETQDDVNLIWINQEDCIRCGACVDACPVDAISIQKVSLQTVPV
ncbi:FAD-dependent oxidoreductase [Tichowtungia aerotolerans]|uniref:FAD-dependent oxidoreductase n=1 Tax=Tichowtungia aerotolerans TaxID=2697043 RepID=A0A6P1M313_9BACT|nr:FAD-dependent oxidoreductase [Tichowtungia aerotolerans]QHI69229.1 FAD-dependent oxidoreductase [Tichowtungia aerotolerans]